MTTYDGYGPVVPGLPADIYRGLTSRWATGIAVITATEPDGPTGCTANAFTSLSLEPPLVITCLNVSSRTLEAVRHGGYFAVNILARDQHDVSRRFAGTVSMTEKFATIPHRIEHGVPVLEGVTAHLICRLERELYGGDHAILIGRLLAGEFDDSCEPLLFFRSAYHQLGDETAATA